MFRFRLSTDNLDDIDWGPNLKCAYEIENNWGDAAQMYRMLSRAHAEAGRSYPTICRVNPIRSPMR